VEVSSQRQKLAVLAIVALGALALVVGAWTRRGPTGDAPAVEIIEPAGGPQAGADDFSSSGMEEQEAEAGTREQQAPAGVVVHVCGRVVRPGVYTLPAGARPSRAAVPAGPVNINTAGPEELDRLPGVGPATAAKIIEYRRAIGGFTRPEDLLGVPGIGEKKFAEMKPYVVVR